MASVDSISNQNQFHELLQTDTQAAQDSAKTSNERDQADFMTLMIAQLQNQNPLDPQDGAEFLSQLAQINSVEQLINLNTNFGDLSSEMRSSQALQATSLVGRKILVDSDVAILEEEGGVVGKVNLPQSTSNLIISIINEDGVTVGELQKGSQAAGEVDFDWDGFVYVEADENSNAEEDADDVAEGDDAEEAEDEATEGDPEFEAIRLPAGAYTIKANYTTVGGDNPEAVSVAASTSIYWNVNSVTLGTTAGVLLNTEGGKFTLADVKEVSNE